METMQEGVGFQSQGKKWTSWDPKWSPEINFIKWSFMVFDMRKDRVVIPYQRRRLKVRTKRITK